MTKEFLYEFISKHKYGVLSSVTPDNKPEAAYVGFAVTPDLKLIFDTVSTSRKYNNLVNNSSIAFVIGWNNEQTVKNEGTAKIPSPDEIDELLETYFKVFPDGKFRKENWKDIAYFCVEPKWIRYSDFNIHLIEEIKF